MILVNGLISAAVWACPGCLGDTCHRPFQIDVRCIGCGRTLSEFAISAPLRSATTVSYLRFPDSEYCRQEFVDFDQAFPECGDPS
ncbi:MAG TPA: hypothetical protein VJ553_00090 [Candidatus Paceibacterota bacterium]|nr:hypothetical protein [Candidatus Paceibacterota bacterium]